MGLLYQRLTRSIEMMWWRKTPPPKLLQGISHIYAWISQRDQRQRISHQKKSPLPLISVGNITAGGSGKTPFVIWLAGVLRARGFEPVVLSRGDGGSLGSPTLIQPSMPAHLVGDEARLLADESHCPVIAGRDRVAAAAMAAQYGNVILLDDGFQYRQLDRDCDIVLLPAEGLGNKHLIPAGPMREPLAALDRADLVVRTGPDPALLPSKQHQWKWLTHITRLEDGTGNRKASPKHVAAVSAIARPERFHDDLARYGCTIDAVRVFPDHHRYTVKDVARILALPAPVVVTAKDAVKLLPLWPRNQPLWIARQEADADSGLLDAILDLLHKS